MAQASCVEDTERTERWEQLGSWWAIVWPSWASNACVQLVSCTDAVFLGHYQGGVYLPASSSALVIIDLTSCIVTRGPCAAVGTLSANAYGARQAELGGRRLQMGLVYTTLLSLAMAPVWAFAGSCLGPLPGSGGVSRADANTVGRWRLLGALPGGWYQVLQSWLAGRAQTRPALYVSAMAVLLNALFNCVLIYGFAGLGGLGFAGSPLATSLTQWMKFLGLLAWSLPEVTACWPTRSAPSFNRPRLRDFMGLCVPLTLSGFLEEFNMQFTAIFALSLGAQDLATHNCMLLAFFFLSTAMEGFTTGTRTRVAHHLVQGRLGSIRSLCRISGTAMFAWSFVVMVAFIALQAHIGRLFSADPEVWALASQISMLVGFLYFLLAGFYLAMGVLEGIARPTAVMVGFVLGCYVVGLPVAYLLGFVAPPEALAWWPHYFRGERPTGCGLLGVWLGLSAGYLTCELVIVVRLLLLRDWDALAARAQELAEVGQQREPLAGDSERDVRRP